jgi:hypothetical protein
VITGIINPVETVVDEVCIFTFRVALIAVILIERSVWRPSAVGAGFLRQSQEGLEIASVGINAKPYALGATDSRMQFSRFRSGSRPSLTGLATAAFRKSSSNKMGDLVNEIPARTLEFPDSPMILLVGRRTDESQVIERAARPICSGRVSTLRGLLGLCLTAKTGTLLTRVFLFSGPPNITTGGVQVPVFPTFNYDFHSLSWRMGI